MDPDYASIWQKARESVAQASKMFRVRNNLPLFQYVNRTLHDRTLVKTLRINVDHKADIAPNLDLRSPA